MAALMEEAVTCEVCSEVYNIMAREPLVLPCGHTFCRSCLVALQNVGSFNCPTCRRDLGYLDIKALPICYPLMSLSSKHIEFKCETCCVHEADLTFWCRDCELPLCGLCLYSGHPQGHDVQMASTCLQEKKQALQEQIRKFSHLLLDTDKEIKSKLKQCFADLKTLSQKSYVLHDVEGQVESLTTEAQQAASFETFLISEAKLRTLKERQIPVLTSDADTTNQESDVTEEEATTGVLCGVGPISQERLAAIGRRNINRRYLKLDCKDDKLLLHSAVSRPYKHFSMEGMEINTVSQPEIEVPSEVFLELSTNDSCLGRVYIQVETRLRRAQQFVMLCLGTLGPTYIGSSFVISNHNQERETLDVRRYVHPDGSTSNKALMSDLEWGGVYAGPVREGMVMGSFYGPDTFGFGICTRGQTGGTFQCPFGEVASGMEVVRAALCHEPIQIVGITNCGLVVPNITP